MKNVLVSLAVLAALLFTSEATWAQDEAIDGVAIPQDVVISEVSYLGDSTQDWVELQNTGTDFIDVTDWWICSRFTYRQLSTLPLLVGADLGLDPGEIVGVATGIDRDNGAADVGLFTINDFPSTMAMVDFVQWGTETDIGRSDVAADKEIWIEEPMDVFDFVPTAATGEAVAYCGADSGGGFLTLSGDFANQAPTQGTVNSVLCALIFSDGFESGDFGGWDGNVTGIPMLPLIHQS